jgi:hypothetical protein
MPSTDVYNARLLEIGRLTTAWAKFEHWIDQALRAPAKVHDREGACLTSQIESIHAKFRALQALMIEADRPKAIQDEVARIAGEAARVVLTRNKFTHGWRKQTSKVRYLNRFPCREGGAAACVRADGAAPVCRRDRGRAHRLSVRASRHADG